jgi:hypothetical protein
MFLFYSSAHDQSSPESNDSGIQTDCSGLLVDLSRLANWRSRANSSTSSISSINNNVDDSDDFNNNNNVNESHLLLSGAQDSRACDTRHLTSHRGIMASSRGDSGSSNRMVRFHND